MASNAKDKLLNAALSLVRANGYTSTTVDALCARAGVTKGAFFHHFASKDDLAIAAVQHWSSMTGALFRAVTYHDHHDPLARLLGYIQLRKELLAGELGEVTCFVGTMVQEAYQNDRIREACETSIFGHARSLEADIAAAKACYAPTATWTPSSLALFTQATLQGAFILAKASGDTQQAVQSVEHLENYVRLLIAPDLRY